MDFNFDLKKAEISQAVRYSQYPIFRFASLFKKIFLVLSIFLFLIFLSGFFTDNFIHKAQKSFLGFVIIFLVLGLFNWVLESFLNSRLKKPKLKAKISEVIKNPGGYNLADFLSFEVARATWKSIKLARRKKLPQISSSALFYYLVSDNPKLNFIFSRALLNLNGIKKNIEAHLKLLKRNEFTGVFSEDFENTILDSFKIAQKKSHPRIEMGDILTALARHELIFKKALTDANLKIKDIENLSLWLENLEEKIEESRKFWDWQNLTRKGSLAKEWAAGFTVTLDLFSTDLTEMMKKKEIEKPVGHKEALEHLERVLARTKINNALLIGEPGSGRRSIINALVQRALYGQSLPEINYKRIVELDVVSILAAAESAEEATNVLDRIFSEAVSAGNVILVIDEFYNFVTQAKGSLGAIDISGILSRYLSLADFRLIGITSYYGLHLFIEKSPAILEYMEKVEVKEISESETILILQNFTAFLERKYKKIIPYPTIRDIVRYSGRYVKDVPFPKKAIDLLDEVLVYTSRHGKSSLVLPEYVSKVISEKTDIPLGEVEIKEKELLLNLENLFHQRIINQEEAVQEVSSALRRARAEISGGERPMGSFLFLGPTGVGKTETSKALAEIYFGSESRMIRIDMSEFQRTEDIPRLIGSPGGEGLLTTQVRENPFSLILLDEIEKSHPNILGLFLQVLDEGHLTDGLGRKIDFKNTIIIATSNAGYQVILEAIKEKKEWEKVKGKLLDYLFKTAVFRPEFINRFDAVVLFKPLSKENLLDIAGLLLEKIKKSLAQKDIDFIITPTLKEKISEIAYDPTFGARHMRRVIQDKVENVLARAILSGELKRGNRVEVKAEGFKLKINS